MHLEDSQRLRYAIMGEQDVDLMYELDQDPEVMRYLTDGKPTTREEIISKGLPRMKAYTTPEKGWGVWKVLLKELDDQFIGWVLIRPMNFFTADRDDEHLEIGWRFMRRYWGNGYATEAARAISDQVLAKGLYLGVNAIADEDNTASVNVMKRLGMSYIKTDASLDPDGNRVCVLYGKTVEVAESGHGLG
ncbi:MAG: GNAT family N-acetyltransferase [Planctomycetota bacterium]